MYAYMQACQRGEAEITGFLFNITDNTVSRIQTNTAKMEELISELGELKYVPQSGMSTPVFLRDCYEIWTKAGGPGRIQKLGPKMNNWYNWRWNISGFISPRLNTRSKNTSQVMTSRATSRAKLACKSFSVQSREEKRWKYIFGVAVRVIAAAALNHVFIQLQERYQKYWRRHTQSIALSPKKTSMPRKPATREPGVQTKISMNGNQDEAAVNMVKINLNNDILRGRSTKGSQTRHKHERHEKSGGGDVTLGSKRNPDSE
ncbi:hypothetical protein B0H17DRAFT_1153781 [Mycena rosella]|uniref:Uncharacterized protein n=1 Tax=Mycena rosella TaxID=1033263 RepID=A0AAD7FAN1_MYCRO|nr:hypothetical protein B0H17DRAFT_1153781 [Mycena rosella]